MKFKVPLKRVKTRGTDPAIALAATTTITQEKSGHGSKAILT
jgi:hypothetical protein